MQGSSNRWSAIVDEPWLLNLLNISKHRTLEIGMKYVNLSKYQANIILKHTLQSGDPAIVELMDIKQITF